MCVCVCVFFFFFFVFFSFETCHGKYIFDTSADSTGRAKGPDQTAAQFDEDIRYPLTESLGFV